MSLNFQENRMVLDGPDWPEMLTIGVSVCEGDCGKTFMQRELLFFKGLELCSECWPKCVAPDCDRKQHPEGEELCAKCSLEIAKDERKSHMLSQRGPMTKEFQKMRLYWDVQCWLWEARQ